ncbi:MAG: hypothetical protein ACPGTU_19235, partial [Myxococcota bacterium]
MSHTNPFSTCRWFAISMLCCGCGLKSLLPGTPVLSKAELASFETLQPSSAAYTTGPNVPFPILPLQGFGLQYAADIVYVSEHPDWDMHEYARLDT